MLVMHTECGMHGLADARLRDQVQADAGLRPGRPGLPRPGAGDTGRRGQGWRGPVPRRPGWGAQLRTEVENRPPARGRFGFARREERKFEAMARRRASAKCSREEGRDTQAQRREAQRTLGQRAGLAGPRRTFRVPPGSIDKQHREEGGEGRDQAGRRQGHAGQWRQTAPQWRQAALRSLTSGRLGGCRRRPSSSRRSSCTATAWPTALRAAAPRSCSYRHQPRRRPRGSGSCRTWRLASRSYAPT